MDLRWLLNLCGLPGMAGILECAHVTFRKPGVCSTQPLPSVQDVSMTLLKSDRSLWNA